MMNLGGGKMKNDNIGALEIAIVVIAIIAFVILGLTAAGVI
jgi:hypothetical protein